MTTPPFFVDRGAVQSVEVAFDDLDSFHVLYLGRYAQLVDRAFLRY